jgi:hypothetical protein
VDADLDDATISAILCVLKKSYFARSAHYAMLSYAKLTCVVCIETDLCTTLNDATFKKKTWVVATNDATSSM